MPEDTTEKTRASSTETFQQQRRKVAKGLAGAFIGAGALGTLGGLWKLLQPTPEHSPVLAEQLELLLTEENLSQMFVNDVEEILSLHIRLFDPDRFQQQKDRILASAEKQAEIILREERSQSNTPRPQSTLNVQGIEIPRDLPVEFMLPEIYESLGIEIELLYPDYRLSGGTLDISLGHLLTGDKLPEPLKRFKGNTLHWKEKYQVRDATYETDEKRTDLDYDLMRQLPYQIFHNIPANLQWEEKVYKSLTEELSYPVIKTNFTSGNFVLSITISGKGDLSYSWVYLNNPHQIPKLVGPQTPTWRESQEQDIKTRIEQIIRPEIWQKLEVSVARQRTDQPLKPRLALWTTKPLSYQFVDTNNKMSLNGTTGYEQDGRHSKTRLIFQLGDPYIFEGRPHVLSLPLNILPGLIQLTRAIRVDSRGQTYEITQIRPDPQIAQWLFNKTPSTWEETSAIFKGIRIPAIKGGLKLDDGTTVETQIDAVGQVSFTETKSFHTPTPHENQ